MSFEEQYEKKIERALKLYLREVHNIEATTASIGMSEVEEGFEGCETCGYGGEGSRISTPIYYTKEGLVYPSFVEIDGTSIGFLPTLLHYIDRTE